MSCGSGGNAFPQGDKVITLLTGYRFFKNKSQGMDAKKYHWINGNPGRMVAAADKGAFLFSFVMANMVVHIHCGLCRACETKCKSKIGKRRSCNLGKLKFEL